MRKLFIALTAGVLLAPLYLNAQTPPPAAEPGRGAGRGGRGAGNEGATAAGAQLKMDEIEYAQAGGQSLKLNLYRLQPAANPMPIIIWIHGSDGVLANRTASPLTGLTAGGNYAVASIDYRSGNGITRTQQLADVKAAIRWLRTNAAAYGLDPAKIGVVGYDVGGQLAALAGTTADVPALNGSGTDASVQAVIDIAGPTNSGGLDASSYVSAGDAPTLIFHGSADAKVSTLESQKLIVPLKVAGINATLDMPFGVGHELGALLSPTVMQTATTFLNAQLKGVQAQGGLSSFISTPPRTYIDPIALDLGGTQYKLYPTTASRGANTFASYRVYLPPDYNSNPTKRYPVIYFLHGRSVDSKRPITAFYISRADAAMRSGVMPPTIIVLAQGDNQGWYMDAQDGRPMASIIVKDLIPHVDATYRTIATREARAIEGHSMGGYGALHIGFKYPDLFSAVTGNSPALVENTTDGVGDQAFWEAQKPATLAKANLAKVKTQKIRIIVGDKDSLFAVGKKLDDDLTAMGVAHEFFGVVGSPHNHDQLVQYETFDTMAFYGNVFKR